MNESERRQLDADVAGCALAHQRLLADLDTLNESAMALSTAPSMLPDWTVGHVLTHIARNADAFRHMIEGAALGEKRTMYPSADARSNDIEHGASKPFATHVADVRTSVWALESSWATLTADGWSGHGITRLGEIAVTDFPWRRWREVEVHHADLGLGFSAADWSPEFIATELARRLTEFNATGDVLPDDVAGAAPWQMLAWLFARPSGLVSRSPAWT